MVLGGWLEVPQVLEARHIRVAEVERHVCVAVIDCIELLSFKESSHIVLNNWSLSLSSDLSPRSFTLDAVSEGEDIIKSFVLECVRIYINHACVVGDASVN